MGGGQQLNQIKHRYPDAECYGIDLSKFSLGKAKQLNNTIHWIKDNVEGTKLPSSGFDVVICSEVIEHVENPNKLVNEVMRISKPNAQIIMHPRRSKKWGIDKIKYICSAEW